MQNVMHAMELTKFADIQNKVAESERDLSG